MRKVVIFIILLTLFPIVYASYDDMWSAISTNEGDKPFWINSTEYPQPITFDGSVQPGWNSDIYWVVNATGKGIYYIRIYSNTSNPNIDSNYSENKSVEIFSKGIIPTEKTAGEPFWSETSNPVVLDGSVQPGDYSFSYLINATGPINSSWLVMAFANSTNPNVYRNDSSEVNVTIALVDTTPPTITFLSKNPSDINSVNVYDNGLNTTYEITDDSGVNNVTFYYKTNSSTTDITQYINGTGEKGFMNTSNYSLSGSNYTFSLTPDEVYPGTYNIRPKLISSLSHNAYSLDKNKKMMKIMFLNVSSNRQYNAFMLYALNKTPNSGDFRIYYCNDSYTSGSVISSPYCVNFFVLPSGVPHVNYPTGGIKYFMIPLGINTTTGEIGGIKVTNTSYIILRGATVGDGWDVYYVSNVTRPNTVQTSSNSGNSWSNFAGTVNAHIHQFDGTDKMWYYVCANDTLGNSDCSGISSDLMDLYGLPPTSPDVYNPTEGIYTGNITINYTEAISPNGYDIAFYNISLVNLDLSHNMTITSNNYLNLSYVWDSTPALTGQYFIKVTACDVYDQCSYGLSENITIYNTYEKQYSQSITATGALARIVYAIRSVTQTITIVISKLALIIQKTFIQPINIQANVIRLASLSRQISQSLTISESVIRIQLSTRNVLQSVSTSLSITRSFVGTRILYANPTAYAVVHRTYYIIRAITEPITVTNTVVRFAHMTREISQTYTATATIFKMLVSGRSIQQSNIITATVSRIFVGTRALSQTISTSYSVIGQRTVVRISTLTVSVSESIVRGVNFSRSLYLDRFVTVLLEAVTPSRVYYLLQSPPYHLFRFFANIENIILLGIALGSVTFVSTLWVWRKRRELFERAEDKW